MNLTGFQDVVLFMVGAIFGVTVFWLGRLTTGRRL